MFTVPPGPSEDSIDDAADGAHWSPRPRVPGARTTRPFANGRSYNAPVTGTFSPRSFTEV